MAVGCKEGPAAAADAKIKRVESKCAMARAARVAENVTEEAGTIEDGAVAAESTRLAAQLRSGNVTNALGEATTSARAAEEESTLAAGARRAASGASAPASGARAAAAPAATAAL